MMFSVKVQSNARYANDTESEGGHRNTGKKKAKIVRVLMSHLEVVNSAKSSEERN